MGGTIEGRIILCMLINIITGTLFVWKQWEMNRGNISIWMGVCSDWEGFTAIHSIEGLSDVCQKIQENSSLAPSVIHAYLCSLLNRMRKADVKCSNSSQEEPVLG